MNIVLIGYRCTGKTSVGRRLSERLGIPFFDTDELVEQRAGRSIREIVEAEGWDLFRRMEKDAIGRLSAHQGAVIALGGGAVADPENGETLRPDGVFVWLMADAETIARRMKGDVSTHQRRPSLSRHGLEAEIRELLEERTPMYRQFANVSVDTVGKGVERVVVEICRRLPHPESSPNVHGHRKG